MPSLHQALEAIFKDHLVSPGKVIVDSEAEKSKTLNRSCKYRKVCLTILKYQRENALLLYTLFHKVVYCSIHPGDFGLHRIIRLRHMPKR